MLKFLKKACLIASCLLILWGFLSWCDIVADNCSSNPHHSEYNLFVIACKGGENKQKKGLTNQAFHAIIITESKREET